MAGGGTIRREHLAPEVRDYREPVDAGRAPQSPVVVEAAPDLGGPGGSRTSSAFRWEAAWSSGARGHPVDLAAHRGQQDPRGPDPRVSLKTIAQQGQEVPL